MWEYFFVNSSSEGQAFRSDATTTCVTYVVGAYFLVLVVLEKTQGGKTQTQGIFRKNSGKKLKKSESSTQKELKKQAFSSKNSRIFEKLKQNFSKNSRNRKVHLQLFAKKRLKNPWGNGYIQACF